MFNRVRQVGRVAVIAATLGGATALAQRGEPVTPAATPPASNAAPKSGIGQPPPKEPSAPPDLLQITPPQIEKRLVEIEKDKARSGDNAEALKVATTKNKNAVDALENAVVQRSEFAGQCRLSQNLLEQARSRGVGPRAIANREQTVKRCQETLLKLLDPVLVAGKQLAEMLKKDMLELKEMAEADADALAQMAKEETALRTMLKVQTR